MTTGSQHQHQADHKMICFWQTVIDYTGKQPYSERHNCLGQNRQATTFGRAALSHAIPPETKDASMKKNQLIIGILALAVHLIARGGLGVILLAILLATIFTPLLQTARNYLSP